jgi:mono/diheme cytochrome c family protein
MIARNTLGRSAALLMLGLLAGGPALAADAAANLAPGPGQDTVAAGCSTCHTTNYIRMNSPFLTPDAWKAEVTKMRTAFGAPIDDEAAAEIITYLGAHYAAPAGAH